MGRVLVLPVPGVVVPGVVVPGVVVPGVVVPGVVVPAVPVPPVIVPRIRAPAHHREHDHDPERTKTTSSTAAITRNTMLSHVV